MCGRTSLFVPQPAIERRFDAAFERTWQPRYNIAPGDDLATITNADPSAIESFRWGLRPSWVDGPEDWPDPINARGETVHEKPAFRGAFDERRCLVLADGFYEWQGPRGSKQPYRIHRADGDPFAFAGLWEEWSANGDDLHTVTIVTTEANETVAPIHDRMPVMLEPDEEARWLEADDEDALRSLLDPFPPSLTEAFPVSRAVNDPSNDSPAVIEPIDTDTQAGLDEFA